MLPRRCSGSLYEALHVAKDASSSDIKKAYFKLALQLHPDKTGGTTTLEFQKIQEAHAILSDDDLRKKYDTFGKEGMRELSNLGVPSEMINGLVIRLLAIMGAFFSLLGLLFVSLVVVRIDRGYDWNWGAVWTPMWLVLAGTTVLGAVVTFQGALQRHIEFALLGLSLVMLLICNAVFVGGILQGPKSLSWGSVLVPFYLIYAIDVIRSALMLRFSRFVEMHRMFASPHLEELERRGLCHPLYLKEVGVEMLRHGLNIAFLILASLRATERSGYEQLSFFSIIAPLLVRISLALLTCWWAVWSAGEEIFPSTAHRVRHTIGFAVLFFPAYFTVCMIAAKCEAELNGSASTFDPSAGVCAIFIFFLFSVLLIGCTCAVCCIAPQFDPVPDDGYREAPSASERAATGPGPARADEPNVGVVPENAQQDDVV